ncbi:hypothetical protein ERO13_A07G170200v2 [Gossypium hirsutum]|nr:hypothetical protein ERO13_A07G170200v2 [Gossypium hirsutum]KAG4192617.1 hypothetical protein ERO13_A07G170200v2 [Gossypium hirsutum]
MERIISSIEQKEESRGNGDHVAIIKEYRGKIEAELIKICDGILSLLESHLIPSASTAESKVFYLKMKGDYHRYLAESTAGVERKEAAESTLLAYKSAQDIAIIELAPTHPIRLGLLLTSLFSTTKSSTHLIVPAILQNRLLMMQFQSWILWVRNLTRIVH